MKNKLLKTLTCFASVFAIGSTIAIASTSCGCSNKQSIRALPDQVYDIDETTHELKGFKSDFLKNPDSEIYQDNFKDCDTMQIPASVTSIGVSAFVNTYSYPEQTTVPSFITKLTFAKGSNCSLIGQSAFIKAASLSSIKFPSSLVTIQNSCFGQCSSLTTIDFSKCTSLELIFGSAFAYCSLLTSVDLSKCSNLTEISYNVFSNCSLLDSVTFPSSLTTIGSTAFYNCSNLSSITWDSWNGSFDSLASDAFSGVYPTGGTVTVKNPVDGHDTDELLKYLLDNGGLPQTWAKTILLPEDVYNIDQNNVLLGFTSEFLANPSAYSDYNTIQIPANVTSIDDNAFFNTCAMTTIIPDFITKLTFAENSNCSSIGDWAFDACPSLASVTFPSSLESIGKQGFYGSTSLPSITFPSSLKTIGAYAFKKSNKLNYIAWDLPNDYQNITINTDAFANISSSGIVKSLNLSIASSQDLLNWIKTKGNFPQTGWEPAD